MDNSIGGEPENTVMKKSFQVLAAVFLGKRKKKSWQTEKRLSTNHLDFS